MKAENLGLLILGGIVGVLLFQKRRDNNTINNLSIQADRLRSLTEKQKKSLVDLNFKLKETVKNNNLSLEVRESLEKTILDYEKLDKDVAKELENISDLIQINQKPKAVFSISKIIENLLKKTYKSKKRFEELINMAKKDNVLTSEECHFVHGLRTIRNKEGHELNVNMEEYLSQSSLLIGVGIVSKLQFTISAN